MSLFLRICSKTRSSIRLKRLHDNVFICQELSILDVYSFKTRNILRKDAQKNVLCVCVCIHTRSRPHNGILNKNKTFLLILRNRGCHFKLSVKKVLRYLLTNEKGLTILIRSKMG